MNRYTQTLVLISCLLFTQSFLPFEAYGESPPELPTVSNTDEVTLSGNKDSGNVNDPYEGKRYPVSGFEGTEDGLTTALNYITVVVIAFFGVSIPMLCWEGVKAIKTTPSLAIFLVGSAVYLIGELVTTILYKNLAAKDASILISKKELGKQIESFEELKAKHESYLKTMKIKFYLAIAVTVIYAIAGIAAIVETVLKKQLSCTSSGKDPTNAATVTQNNFSPPKSIFNLFNSLSIANSFANTIPDIHNSVPDAGSSIKNIGGGIIPDIDISVSDLTQTYSIVKFVLLGLGGALGAVLAIVFKKVVFTQKAFFNTLLTSSYTRIALFLGSAAAVGVFIILVKKQMGKLEKRIDYLDNLLATLKNFQSYGGSYAFSGGIYDDMSDYLPPVTLPPELQSDAPRSGENLPCVTSTKDARVLGIDKNCDCAKGEKSCDPKAMPDPTKTDLKFPGSIMSSLGDATKTVKGLAGGNLTGSLGSLSSLVRNAGRINNLKNKYLDKFQDHLKKEKAPTFDLSKEQDKIFNTIKDDIRKKFKDQKADMNALGNWGDVTFGTGGDALDRKLPKIPKVRQEVKDKLPKTSKKKEPDALDAFIIDNFEENLNYTTPPTAVEDESVILHDGHHDLNPKDKNIFGIISSRYFRSAYPVFFESID